MTFSTFVVPDCTQIAADVGVNGLSGVDLRVGRRYGLQMPPPPILEIYVVWHPDDELGTKVAQWLQDHFHGPAYAGLAGGAVEVYSRSMGWQDEDGPPRPLPFMQPLPAFLPRAQFTAVVPVLGTALAGAVRDQAEWDDYIAAIFAADAARLTLDSPVGVFPLKDPRLNLPSTSRLATLSRRPQLLPEAAAENAATLGREVSQAIVQRLTGGQQVTTSPERSRESQVRVFVSHTKHHTTTQQEAGPHLLGRVREVIHNTRLGEFFDAADIPTGSDWEAALDAEAGRSALLMVRTDLYATREWTQREVLTAKRRDIPVVALYAVREDEARGSFLMDHVPVIPCPAKTEDQAIERALNRLVDEALKRALWREQSVYLQGDHFDWLPNHSPEPVTLVPWLASNRSERQDRRPVRILHPDPPLGECENAVIVEVCALAGIDAKDVHVLTPRTLATQGMPVQP